MIHHSPNATEHDRDFGRCRRAPGPFLVAPNLGPNTRLWDFRGGVEVAVPIFPFN